MYKDIRTNSERCLTAFFAYIKNLVIHNIFSEKKGHFTNYHVYLSYDKRGKADENSKDCNM